MYTSGNKLLHPFYLQELIAAPARWPQDTDKWAPVAALLPKEGYPFRIQCDKRHPLVGDKEGAKEHSAFKTAIDAIAWFNSNRHANPFKEHCLYEVIPVSGTPAAGEWHNLSDHLRCINLTFSLVTSPGSRIKPRQYDIRSGARVLCNGDAVHRCNC